MIAWLWNRSLGLAVAKSQAEQRKTEGANSDERFDFGALDDLLGSHTPRNFPRVSLDTSDHGMRVRTVFCTFVRLFDDHDLLTGVATRENDGNLAGFVDCREEGVQSRRSV